MDFRKINKIESSMYRATGRRRHPGRYCPCCCSVGGNPNEERHIVARSRRRLDKAIIEVEMAEYTKE